MKKLNLLILYSEMLATCSSIHNKNMNKLCAQKVEFFMLNLVVKTKIRGL